MKRILPNNLQFIFLLLFFVFSESVMAQCTITGINNASTLNPNPCTTLTNCNGVLNIGDGSLATSLVINANLDLTCLGPIQLIINTNANIDFSNSQNTLTLASGSSIYFVGTGTLIPYGGNGGSGCQGADKIFIGNLIVAACNGNSGIYTFPGLVGNGGYTGAAGKIGTNQTICSGSTPALLTSITDGSGTGTITYEWEKNDSGSWLNISGANTNTYAPPSLTTTTKYRRRTVEGTIKSAYTLEVIITVNPNVTPTFTPVGAICSGATLAALPTTSNNGITGTWSPALNNTATTTYTFTPTAGQCATTTTLTIDVNPLVADAGTITGNDYVISGNTGTYNVLPILNATSYVWTYYNSANVVLNTITTSSNSLTFIPTEFEGYLKVRGINSTCIGQDSTKFDIFVGLSPSPPTITGPTEVCKGQNGVVFSIDNIVTSYNWTVPAGVVIISGQGTKEITVNYTDLAVEGAVAISIVTPFGLASNSLNVKPKSNTWIGASNASWFTASNWSCGFVPNDKTDVMISDVTNDPMIDGTNTEAFANTITVDSGSLTVNVGNTLNVKNKITNISGQLIFENNSSLIQTSTVANSGSIEYRRISSPMKNFDYTYWSSPVTGQTAKLLSPNTLADKYFKYDPISSTGWVFDDGLMAPGVGYIIRVPKPGTIYPNGENWNTPTYAQPVAFKGVPNNGNYSFAVEADQYNLIGNPYPSALDATKFMQDNSGIIYGALYFWTHKTAIQQSGSNYIYVADDYATYTLTGGVAATSGGLPPSGKIAAGQSFFVGNTAAGSFQFTNAMRVAGNNTQFFKQASTKKTAAIEKNRVWLNLTNAQGAFKQLLMGYITGATNDWDNLYDGPTFDGQPFVDFYSINKGQNLSIQGRALPFQTTDEVPLGYRSTIAGTFDISIDSRDGLLANQKIWLEDKKTNTFHELSNGKYTFTTINGVENDRFVLKFLNTNKKLSSSEKELTDKQILVSIENKKITITSSEETIAKVHIFDMLGRKVYASSKINEQVWSITTLAASDQVLIVKTTLTNGSVSTKKIIY